ncbi:type I-C CRISPR-associated protein Cas7/Csd2 [Lysinibacillus macroides]|uniref:CRISPR-associated protein n=1 Tax=Lysinibacillus macroides TaxID=33935 RepID=A0A0M9DLM1_9BACI|nr:type I-C CRISPR-associated protein Cas7/Csd2 [Lysinibacillus macroides]KOY83399.1 CRISPR-associated protein [Lysinibacillus macroides]QPR69270.1 type I-C CRISPR-associated protein Cas7/Csd2 [Lysinibacillus macroides]
MTILDYKVDFAVIFSVHNANPNGDPLNGNRPRQNFDGYGEVSDVCIKRKLRNRLQDLGEAIFVQSDERAADGFKSLNDRADSISELKKIKADKKGGDADTFATIAAQTWYDVRAFGQVFAFKGSNLSVGVRGPVSVHPAISVQPIDITSIQITKSVNSVTGDKKGSDTMGMKHRVDFGVYKFVGSINTQLAEKTGFTRDDAKKLQEALVSLFENDASSARPEGSLEVHKVIWWEHDSKLGQYSSAKVHRSLKVEMPEGAKEFKDEFVQLTPLEGLQTYELDGK